jgi:NADH-quinone oxidoreductase subunit L
MTVPLIILSIFALGLGVIALPWLGKDIYTFLDFDGLERPGGLNLSILLQSDILAVAGILAAFLLYGLKLVRPETIRKRAGFLYTVVANKFYVDELYMLLIRGLFLTVTRVVAWFDRKVVDGAVNVVGFLSKRSGDALRLTVTGKVQNYALVIFGGAVAALAVALVLTLGGGR